MKVVRKIIETKRTLSTADSDGYHGFDDKLCPYMLSNVGYTVEEVLIHPVYQEWIKALWISLYFPEKAELDKYDYVAPFLDAAFISCDHHANVAFLK